MFRFALVCLGLFSIVPIWDVEAGPVTSATTLEASIVACIPSPFQCNAGTSLNLSDPTSTSGSLFTSITDPRGPATYTVSYVGNASASFNSSKVSVRAFVEINCDSSTCLRSDQLGSAGDSHGLSEAHLSLSDQITFFTGLGGGFYEIVADEHRDAIFNSDATVTVQGVLLQSRFGFGELYTTAPMPFVDGVPFTLSLSARAEASACCDSGDLDAGNVTDDIFLTLIALDSNMQPIQSLGYTDSTGQYTFGRGEVGTLVPEPSTGLLVLTAAGLVLCRWAVKESSFNSSPGPQ